MKNLLIFMVCMLLLSCSPNTQDSNTICGCEQPNEPNSNSICGCEQLNEQNSNSICGCEQPNEDLPWLKELIQKSEIVSRENCHYWGCIWHGKFNGKDIFIVDMMLGSGGVAFWAFDCCGNHLVSHGREVCPACKFVGNNHFYLDEEDKDFIMYAASHVYNLIHCGPESIYRLTD